MTYTLDELRKLLINNTELKQNILSQKYYHPNTKDVLKRYFFGEEYSFNINFSTLGNRQYNINDDVIVFLHMQKTGGTHINARFRRSLDLPFKCRNIRDVSSCVNTQGHIWFHTSAFTWWVYFYITQIRDPLSRYLSEYRHQTERSHWEEATLGCKKREKPYWNDIRPCFLTENWKGVSFSTFMNCPFNLATNRMTRMLADLVPTGCYQNFQNEFKKIMRARKWVESAKQNILNMEHFRLMERSDDSDFLFNKAFNIKFKAKDTTPTSSSRNLRITEKQFLKMIQLTELDFHIYLYALDIFNYRLETTSHTN
ncbi:H6ST1-like protein [Mya arenaria]|uniref:Heparan-sulfate 6-O-sulfotransferase n=1 Tax=Mya arenaria TaxID=6604 RepID=A0ABY7FRI6_MYAAR|nr:H6ST1-like protein [Mya arenaria]